MMCRMGRASDSVVRLTKETKMDFTKLDLSKFDVSKLMDADTVIDQIEKNSHTALGFITDAKSREIAQTISTASIEFARAQAAAVKAYHEAVKKVVQA
jgi:hypothetical protein